MSQPNSQNYYDIPCAHSTWNNDFLNYEEEIETTKEERNYSELSLDIPIEEQSEISNNSIMYDYLNNAYLTTTNKALYLKYLNYLNFNFNDTFQLLNYVDNFNLRNIMQTILLIKYLIIMIQMIHKL